MTVLLEEDEYLWHVCIESLNQLIELFLPPRHHNETSQQAVSLLSHSQFDRICDTVADLDRIPGQT